jgi:arginine/lysine/ornithine decarboxylase
VDEIDLSTPIQLGIDSVADNLCHPVSVIREAEELAADAFGAAHAFLMVGGTTSSVQSMVLTACKRGDEIILPRNVHRSVLNALVLCGAGHGTVNHLDPVTA